MIEIIDFKKRRVLSDLKAIVSTLDLPIILVGAGARLLIFDRIFGEGRGTTDLDIAVSIESWETYQQLENTLIGGDPPLFQKTNVWHRFKHIETNIDIDIVPFGKIGEPDQKIEWTDTDTDSVMNVAGFSEALSHATIERIEDLEIQVITIPSFVVLKIFAWGDRGDRTNQDLKDLDFVLSKYEDDERAYDKLCEELATGEVALLDASIYLLGQDIYRLLQPKTFLELNQVLEKLIQKKGDDKPGTFGYRLNILQQGINSRSPDPGS